MRVTFEVFGEAQPQGSLKAFMRPGARFPTVTSDNPQLRAWRHLVAIAAQSVAGTLFRGPVVLEVMFLLPRPVSLPRRIAYPVKRPDLDKLVRSVFDALTGVLYVDDNQVIDVIARKRYAAVAATPRACITIAEAERAEPEDQELFR